MKPRGVKSPSKRSSPRKLSLNSKAKLPTTPSRGRKFATQAPKGTSESTKNAMKSPAVAVAVTSSEDEAFTDPQAPKPSPSTPSRSGTPKKRLSFGRETLDYTQPNVRKVYSIVSRQSGNLGGNGHGGAIYGELTVGSMQKVIDFMKDHMDFDKTSNFIDVGSGLGKPNLHVAQDPGVEFSYGIEMEHVRWMLGMNNLRHVLKEAKKHHGPVAFLSEDERIGHRCIFEHGNITQAKTFDPFTHVYMFSIGFPPTLFEQLSTMFNNSSSPYLICFQGPRLIINSYDFDVELITQTPTAMHGSSEGHTVYFYRRKSQLNKEEDLCDPFFAEARKRAAGTVEDLFDFVNEEFSTHCDTGRSRRKRKPRTDL